MFLCIHNSARSSVVKTPSCHYTVRLVSRMCNFGLVDDSFHLGMADTPALHAPVGVGRVGYPLEPHPNYTLHWSYYPINNQSTHG